VLKSNFSDLKNEKIIPKEGKKKKNTRAQSWICSVHFQKKS
jgi:hypothetical protein